MDYKPRFGTAIAPWHKWFAWRPVQTVDQGYKWLIFVNRRKIIKHDYLDGGPDEWWQYCVETLDDQLA